VNQPNAPRKTMTTMELLQHDWGSAYEIEPGRAVRRDGLGEVTGATPDELREAIAADYAERRVPRDVAP
jgi:hypothetical protein